ncbi:Aldose 1-epimerase precursor [Limihaloglobus sulfuriphilus]|uniref:Aldose 1-epimerase n=1 Tax=Limihaloglobus sulfuriphilus TaxID=1851148 RepID=A0A1Q2MDB5_9BACT|nr:aldose epimerase family protein [Limihaloglobus sulfuriphilus]AQQ70649.1 Aldose 1-epimerase precursor [Limihaloglobus sulfuriphilus]
MSVQQRKFAQFQGNPITMYILSNKNGMKAEIIDYGAILVSLYVPDRGGNIADVTLGFDELESYAERSPYFGATVGRVANRIDSGSFTLDGVEYQLAKNENGRHHLHGGNKGFNNVIWRAQPLEEDDFSAVTLNYMSPDGEENYPGNLNVTVTYTLTDENELKIDFDAVADKATPVNLTHHSYFNLAAEHSADILGHEMEIFADSYTPVNDDLIPTGKIAPVAGTALDFTHPHAIGERIGQTQAGYDHNYILGNDEQTYILAARTYEPKSGRVMETYTNQPAIQFYSGNFLDGIKGKSGKTYSSHSAFCLEPQIHPNAVNTPGFPDAILRPGQRYRHNMAYVFSVR